MNGVTGRARQIPFDLPPTPGLTREDFLAAPGNAEALALVDAAPGWSQRTAAIAGPEGAGKSHLAAIFAVGTGARVLPAASLARAEVPEALQTGALVLEDLDRGPIDEAALFHALNLAREQGALLLLTARVAPAHLPFATADLVSRLRAVPVAKIAPADDALLAAVLVKLFADRQVSVDAATVQYLLNRMQRTVAGAQHLVAAIDREALAAGRPVTRALAAQVIRDNPELAVAMEED